MSRQVFRLNGVGEEEHNEVCNLLKRYGIDYYETSAGRWGFGIAAIWINDQEEALRARELIDIYQQQRTERFSQKQPQIDWLWRFYQKPVEFILIVLGIIAVLAISSLPVILLW